MLISTVLPVLNTGNTIDIFIVMRKCFSIVFLNTSISSERIRIFKSVEKMKELDPDSTDTFKQNIVDRYKEKQVS